MAVLVAVADLGTEAQGSLVKAESVSPLSHDEGCGTAPPHPMPVALPLALLHPEHSHVLAPLVHTSLERNHKQDVSLQVQLALC